VDLLGFCEGKYARDAGEHLFEACNFALEMARASLGEAVDSGRTAFRGCAGFGLEQAFAQHSLESGVEGTLFDLKQIVGDLLDVFHERVAVHRFEPERLQDHHFERSGEEIAAFGILGHRIKI